MKKTIFLIITFFLLSSFVIAVDECIAPTLIIQKNFPQTLTCGGTEYVVDILGGNPDDHSAILRVNYETRTIYEGQSKTMDGLQIHIKEINIGYNDDISAAIEINNCCCNEVPEFGVITFGLSIIGVLGVFIYLRRC